MSIFGALELGVFGSGFPLEALLRAKGYVVDVKTIQFWLDRHDWARNELEGQSKGRTRGKRDVIRLLKGVE